MRTPVTCMRNSSSATVFCCTSSQMSTARMDVRERKEGSEGRFVDIVVDKFGLQPHPSSRTPLLGASRGWGPPPTRASTLVRCSMATILTPPMSCFGERVDEFDVVGVEEGWFAGRVRVLRQTLGRAVALEGGREGGGLWLTPPSPSLGLQHIKRQQGTRSAHRSVSATTSCCGPPAPAAAQPRTHRGAQSPQRGLCCRRQSRRRLPAQSSLRSRAGNREGGS